MSWAPRCAPLPWLCGQSQARSVSGHLLTARPRAMHPPFVPPLLAPSVLLFVRASALLCSALLCAGFAPSLRGFPCKQIAHTGGFGDFCLQHKETRCVKNE
jgi:hypothetical protein